MQVQNHQYNILPHLISPFSNLSIHSVIHTSIFSHSSAHFVQIFTYTYHSINYICSHDFLHQSQFTTTYLSSTHPFSLSLTATQHIEMVTLMPRFPRSANSWAMFVSNTRQSLATMADWTPSWMLRGVASHDRRRRWPFSSSLQKIESNKSECKYSKPAAAKWSQ